MENDIVEPRLLKVKNMMNLTRDELFEMRKFLSDHKDDKKLLSSILKSGMNEKQKVFLVLKVLDKSA